MKYELLNGKQILSLGSSVEEEMRKLVGTLEMTGPAPWLRNLSIRGGPDQGSWKSQVKPGQRPLPLRHPVLSDI